MDTAADDGGPICAKCSRQQATCCQRTEILVTRVDIERIATAIGHDDFHERRAPSDPEQLPCDEDVLWSRAFAADGTRAILKHQPNGDCCFLGAAGCVLGMEVRPFICRLYPYEYDHVAIKGVTAHHCPAPMRDNPALALTLLDMNREEAERWRKALYAALIHE